MPDARPTDLVERLIDEPLEFFVGLVVPEAPDGQDGRALSARRQRFDNEFLGKAESERAERSKSCVNSRSLPAVVRSVARYDGLELLLDVRYPQFLNG